MSKTLSVVLLFIFTIMFFAPLIPGLTIFGIFGSFTFYWVLKFLLTRRKIKKKNISADLILFASDTLKFGVLANSICGIFFFKPLVKGRNPALLLNFILGVLFFILPTKSVILYLFNRDSEDDEEGDYYQFEKKLKHYDLENPVTRASGLSRLEGKSLKESIRKCILKVLIGRVEAKNEKKIEDAQTNAFGMEGLGMLISLQKKKNQAEILDNVGRGDVSPAPLVKPTFVRYMTGDSGANDSPERSSSAAFKSRLGEDSSGEDQMSPISEDEEDEESSFSNRV